MLTLSNRETFAVLHWLDENPKRRARVRGHAARLASSRGETSIPRLSELLLKELQSELPRLKGVAAEILHSGIARVNFYEIAVALLIEAGMQPPALVPSEG